MFFVAVANWASQVPFRSAHTISGRCVSLAEQSKCSIKDLELRQLKEIW